MDNKKLIKNSSGFYFLKDNKLLYAPNRVVSKTIDLQREKKDTYTFPVEGWYWFDSEQEAEKFFNIDSAKR